MPDEISCKDSSLPDMTGIGLGCWAIGGRDWGSQKDCYSIQTIKSAYANGVRHFDTAQSYGRGHSEELLGRTLRKYRNKCFIASKIVYMPPEKVDEAVSQSLNRLQTDYLDLLYIHWPKKNADLAAMMAKLEKLREKGIIRKIGVSNFSIEQMREISRAGKIDVCQMCYNLLWRWPEKELIPYCKENAISAVAYSTIAQGILTGKFDAEPDFVNGDHRRKTVLFEKDVWPAVFSGVSKLKEVAASVKLPLRDLSIQWVLKRDGVTSALVGARNADQVKENVQALSAPMSMDTYKELTAISDQIMTQIPDTGNIFRYYP